MILSDCCNAHIVEDTEDIYAVIVANIAKYMMMK